MRDFYSNKGVGFKNTKNLAYVIYAWSLTGRVSLSVLLAVITFFKIPDVGWGIPHVEFQHMFVLVATLFSYVAQCDNYC